MSLGAKLFIFLVKNGISQTSNESSAHHAVSHFMKEVDVLWIESLHPSVSLLPPYLPSFQSPSCFSHFPLRLMFNLNLQCRINKRALLLQQLHSTPTWSPKGGNVPIPLVARAWKRDKPAAKEVQFSCSQRGFAMFSQGAGLKVVIT